ncbi:MAG: hypothetical protein V3V08_19340 [Nannocystaceae bacterium]
MNSPRRSKDQWRTIIEEFEAGKLNQEEFARARGVKLGTFRSRLYEFRKAAKSPRFVEVERPTSLRTATHRPPVTVTVGNTRIEFSERPSPEFFIELIEGLRKEGS